MEWVSFDDSSPPEESMIVMKFPPQTEFLKERYVVTRYNGLTHYRNVYIAMKNNSLDRIPTHFIVLENPNEFQRD